MARHKKDHKKKMDFQKPLADAVRKNRNDSGLTQRAVADLIDTDPRTIMNIEKGDGNPKMEVLNPLVQTLKIDPWDIFFPDKKRENEHSITLWELQKELDSCTEQEAQVLMPVCKAILKAIRGNYPDISS